MQTTVSETIISFTFLLILFFYNKKLGTSPNLKQSSIIIICTTTLILIAYVLLYLYTAGDGTVILEAVPPTSELPRTTIFGSDFLIDAFNVAVVNLFVLNIFSFIKVFVKK